MLKMIHSGVKVLERGIKPCPFCGNQDLTISEEDSFKELVRENGESLIEIECSSCDTVKRLFDIPENNYWMGVGMLVATWNRRVEE